MREMYYSNVQVKMYWSNRTVMIQIPRTVEHTEFSSFFIVNKCLLGVIICHEQVTFAFFSLVHIFFLSLNGIEKVK